MYMKSFIEYFLFLRDYVRQEQGLRLLQLSYYHPLQLLRDYVRQEQGLRQVHIC